MNASKVTWIAAALTAALAAAPASAQGLPSSKATADVSTLVKCHMSTAQTGDGAVLPSSCVDLFTGTPVATQNQWIPIMDKKMKLSNSQSVVLSSSLVSGLYTRTRTKTTPKTETTSGSSTAEAMGAVYLRAVLVPDDGRPEVVAAPLSMCRGGVLGCAEPEAGKWGVILDSRVQTLSQELSACVIDVDSIPGTTDGSCTFESTIDLVLKTTSANSFNFIFPNVGQGTYTVKALAAVGSGASIIAGNGSAVGAAAFGLGSMVAESVRFVHDFEF